MKTAGIVVDSYKLPTFRRHLDAAGYGYTQHPGLTPDTATLKVVTDDPAELAAVVKAANDEARKGKA